MTEERSTTRILLDAFSIALTTIVADEVKRQMETIIQLKLIEQGVMMSVKDSVMSEMRDWCSDSMNNRMEAHEQEFEHKRDLDEYVHDKIIDELNDVAKEAVEGALEKSSIQDKIADMVFDHGDFSEQVRDVIKSALD